MPNRFIKIKCAFLMVPNFSLVVLSTRFCQVPSLGYNILNKYCTSLKSPESSIKIILY